MIKTISFGLEATNNTLGLVGLLRFLFMLPDRLKMLCDYVLVIDEDDDEDDDEEKGDGVGDGDVDEGCLRK